MYMIILYTVVGLLYQGSLERPVYVMEGLSNRHRTPRAGVVTDPRQVSDGRQSGISDNQGNMGMKL